MKNIPAMPPPYYRSKRSATEPAPTATAGAPRREEKKRQARRVPVLWARPAPMVKRMKSGMVVR
jgi:hypothetical protein